MSEQWFRTTTCASRGHPEISIRLVVPLPVPGLEQTLLGYFETQVARGVRFAPEQIVDFGGIPLRLFARPDGTIGVSQAAHGVWQDSVHEALALTWFRQEVARSFALEPMFPRSHGTMIVCTHVSASRNALMLKRGLPTPNTADTGWFIGCTDETHDHDAPESLLCVPLSSVESDFPWLAQFFALPIGTDLVVEMDERVAVPVLWRGEDELSPGAGSYVESINTAART